MRERQVPGRQGRNVPQGPLRTPQECAELIRRNYESVYAFLVYLSGDAALAEDLTQDTFASAWSKSAQYEGRASFGSWLRGIAYRKFIDATRRGRRFNAAMAQLRNDRRHAPQEPSPLRRILEDERSRMMFEAVQQLPAPERTAVILHYVQGLSFAELAETLDEPVGTAKWRTNRALKLLRAMLNGKSGP